MANQQKRPYEPDDPTRPNRGQTGNMGNTGAGQGRGTDRGPHPDKGSDMHRDRPSGGRPGETGGSSRQRDMDPDIEE